MEVYEPFFRVPLDRSIVCYHDEVSVAFDGFLVVCDEIIEMLFKMTFLYLHRSGNLR